MKTMLTMKPTVLRAGSDREPGRLAPYSVVAGVYRPERFRQDMMARLGEIVNLMSDKAVDSWDMDADGRILQHVARALKFCQTSRIAGEADNNHEEANDAAE